MLKNTLLRGFGSKFTAMDDDDPMMSSVGHYTRPPTHHNTGISPSLSIIPGDRLL